MSLFIGVFLLLISLLLYLSDDNIKEVAENETEIVFTSKFSRGGAPTALEKLIKTEHMISWKINKGLNWLYTYSDSIAIPWKNIVGVQINKKLISCDIQIIGNGVQRIYASKFSVEDANKIEKIIKLGIQQ